VDYHTSHLTRAFIDLDHLTHNMRLLQSLVGNRPLWPAIKANAYGHGANIVARHLVDLGYNRLCVANPAEAIELIEAGVEATFIVLSATLPETSGYFVAYGLEPAVCTPEMVAGLARAARKAGRRTAVHLKVDTGMGRVGIRPEEVAGFLEHCRNFPEITIKGLMSHFPCADEVDKTFSHQQIKAFHEVKKLTHDHPIEVFHMANSAAIFDLPESHFDAARPGISIYGLKPSQTMHNPRVKELKSVLEWKTSITFLKEVPAGTGLSYGRTYFTDRPSLIATVPVGYGDGLSRLFSNRREFLVHGVRCPQVGRITMDQSLLDVTDLRGTVALGDEAVIIGRQDDDEITTDELAAQLGTINYEIVTAISRRVPRIAVGGAG
jgi:alanine racemase